MKFKEEQLVILLDMEGNPAVNAIVRGYETSTGLYRINYKYPTSDEIWIDDVPEERLVLLPDIASK